MSGSDDRYEDEWSGVVLSQCASCRHNRHNEPGCAAFPDGIPDVFLTNRADHRKPQPFDRGIRFEPRPDVTPATLAALARVLDELP